MVDGITGGRALPAEVMDEVVSKTDGVPLFVEELTKMVLESGLLRLREGNYELAGPLPPLAIPTTLQDSLMARLDRLGTTKEVVQLGAVLGREFSHELLASVSSLDPETLEGALDRLLGAELLFMLVPFTKLAHVVLVAFDRISAVHWQLRPGAGARVAEALFGKEAKV